MLSITRVRPRLLARTATHLVHRLRRRPPLEVDEDAYTMNVEFYTGVDQRLDVPMVLPPVPEWWTWPTPTS